MPTETPTTEPAPLVDQNNPLATGADRSTKRVAPSAGGAGSGQLQTTSKHWFLRKPLWLRFRDLLHRAMHRNRSYTEGFYDLRADEPGGPRTVHGIKWTCTCGYVLDGGSSP